MTFSTEPPPPDDGSAVGPEFGWSIAELNDEAYRVIDLMLDQERIIRAAEARRAELIERTRQLADIRTRRVTPNGRNGFDAAAIAREETAAEVAYALRIPEPAAQNLIRCSTALVQDFAPTMEALREGSISYRHAEKLLDHAWSLPEKVWSEFEKAVLPAAKALTVGRFNRNARTARERMHPASISERHVAAVAERSVDLQPARDGMAWLTIFDSAEKLTAIYNRACDTAKALRGPDDPRTLAQIRADACTDLLLDGHVGDCDDEAASADSATDTKTDSATNATADPARTVARRVARGIQPTVLVTVPVLTLLGRSEEPGDLEGYGPIDPETARQLAGKATSFIRLLTHPETGAVLSVGRDRYNVPRDLRLWVRIRDVFCRVVGCNRPARECEMDHTEDWQYGGETDHGNLASLCHKHHAIKHHTGIQVKQVGEGVLEWRTPSGHTYRTEPENRIGSSIPPATDSPPREDSQPLLPRSPGDDSEPPLPSTEQSPD